MYEGIVCVINPVYEEVVNRMSNMFDEKLQELRKDPSQRGKYLIGLSDKPYEDMAFEVSTRKDYEEIEEDIKNNEAIFGEEI